MIAARAVQGIGAATLARDAGVAVDQLPGGRAALAGDGRLRRAGRHRHRRRPDRRRRADRVAVVALGLPVNVPIGLAAIIAAPRYLDETGRHAGRLDVPGALGSTLGAAALVFGIVHSADAGWGDDTTMVALALGTLLIAVFVTGQARATQPLMPLRLFADRGRAGAYAARFLFNGVLVSFYFFMTQYLQGVSDYTPLEAGLAFLPVTAAAFAAATVTSRLSRRLGNESLAVAGVAAMLVGTAWTSRVGADTAYLVGIALPMLVFGIGQGLGLSALTTGGMARVSAKDAGVAGGLVNVAHHLGGALGLGMLVAVFDAAGAAGDGPREMLAHRVSAALTIAAALLVLALLVTLIARPRRAAATPSVDDVPPAAALAAEADTLVRRLNPHPKE